MLDVQPASASSIAASSGAESLRRAFAIMSRYVYTAMHNEISIREGGFKEVYAE
jgi:hypothetical protein